jgi:adenylate cyclase
MPIEIERKFLVVGDGWRSGPPGQRFCQGYLARTDGVTVRVRCAGSRAYLTVKGKADGLVRPEFEYEVPVGEAEAMLTGLCRRPLIEKVRHEVTHEGLVWNVDEFQGENAGLILAEIELDHPNQPVALPPWIGREVTHDPRYRNSRLVDEPQGDSFVNGAARSISSTAVSSGPEPVDEPAYRKSEGA